MIECCWIGDDIQSNFRFFKQIVKIVLKKYVKKFIVNIYFYKIRKYINFKLTYLYYKFGLRTHK